MTNLSNLLISLYNSSVRFVQFPVNSTGPVFNSDADWWQEATAVLGPCDSVAFLALSEPRKCSRFLDRTRRPHREDTEAPDNQEGQAKTINWRSKNMWLIFLPQLREARQMSCMQPLRASSWTNSKAPRSHFLVFISTSYTAKRCMMSGR